LGAHFFGDRESCCVVACSVDSEARAEFFYVFADLAVVDSVLSVAVDGCNVVVDTHDIRFLSCVREFPYSSVFVCFFLFLFLSPVFWL